MVKENQVNVSDEIDRLFKAFTNRMNALPGWCTNIPPWLKNTDPGLYTEWAEIEYLIDERWGMNDLGGFKTVLNKYEAICLDILKKWRMVIKWKG
jgi:hypothetical protein